MSTPHTPQTTPLWVAEFGPEWQVPPVFDALVADDKLAETSWHHDEAPSFVNHVNRRRIWILHPTEREASHRFAVVDDFGDDPAVFYNGDDVTLAALALFNL